jgi:LPS-assembly lipoprotein
MTPQKKHILFQRILSIVLMNFLMLTISACGFKLRGAVHLPYRAVLVSGTMSVDLRQNLTRGIELGTNTQVVNNAKDSDLIIEIVQDQNSKQILSYNASGQITAYRLVNLVKFRVLDGQGNELIEDSDVYLTRDMDFSISTILAAEMTELELMRAMRQDIAAQILRRISALSKTPKK